jgi:hypothetical protein
MLKQDLAEALCSSSEATLFRLCPRREQARQSLGEAVSLLRRLRLRLQSTPPTLSRHQFQVC